MKIEERIKQGETVEIWSNADGDGHRISIEAHESGFFVNLEGTDRGLEENPYDFVSTETYLTFDMLNEMREAMEKHKHLVEDEGN